MQDGHDERMLSKLSHLNFMANPTDGFHIRDKDGNPIFWAEGIVNGAAENAWGSSVASRQSGRTRSRFRRSAFLQRRRAENS